MNDIWNDSLACTHIHRFESLTAAERHSLTECLNKRFPPSVFFDHREKSRRAADNVVQGMSLLHGMAQGFPKVIDEREAGSGDPSAMAGCAIVFTAGGEGERLRLTLLERGVSESLLGDFTKATFGLPGFPQNAGTLQANIALVGELSRRAGREIPVVVTTGPEGSVTSTVIQRMAVQSGNFGLRHLLVVPQDERLHLTAEGQIPWERKGEAVEPVTNPDETGGPLMKLKKPATPDGRSALQWIRDLGCERIIVLQGTALYDPAMVAQMAAVSVAYECLGVGIPRSAFPPGDPYGTFVSLRGPQGERTVIIEQGVRNDATREVRSDDGRHFLPFNTGFYVLETGFLARVDLPDYATPPKEVLPGLARSPKIGYSATDLLGLAARAAIFTVNEQRYCVIKNADDLEKVAALGKRYKLDLMCERSAM